MVLCLVTLTTASRGLVIDSWVSCNNKAWMAITWTMNTRNSHLIIVGYIIYICNVLSLELIFFLAMWLMLPCVAFDDWRGAHISALVHMHWFYLFFFSLILFRFDHCQWRRQLWGIGVRAPPRLCSVMYYLPCIRQRGMFRDDFVCRVYRDCGVIDGFMNGKQWVEGYERPTEHQLQTARQTCY